MQKFNCPSCGAEITFQSSISVSCVCPYCRSLVVRHDKDMKAIGKMAELPADISPFQIGTTGKFDNVTFTLIGRMKIGWEDGNWNEWFMYFDDGRRGWLAEAQGALAVNFEVAEKEAPVKFPKLGEHIKLQDKPFVVADIKEGECIGSEGELPFTAPQGRKTKSVDLLDNRGGFASMEYCPPEPIRIYMGDYVDFDNLQFSNLRELPGWSMKRPPLQEKQPAKKKKKDGGW